MYTIIVALDSKNGISKQSRIPWKSSSDLQFFRKTTIGNQCNAVVMGKATYDTLPVTGLPQRLNVVLSTKMQPAKGLVILHSMDEFGSFLECNKCDEIFVIGGAIIIEQIIANYPTKCERILISRIEGDFGCDKHLNIDDFITSGFKLKSTIPKVDHTLYELRTQFINIIFFHLKK